MAESGTARWTIHKQLLGSPSYIGVTLFIMAGLHDNWWIGLPMFLVVLAAYNFLYETCFTFPERRSLKGISLSVGLVLFQIAYWAGGFWLANSILRRALVA